MSVRKPLVLNGGQIEQLQAGDVLQAIGEIEGITQTNGEAGAITVGMPVYSSGVDTVKKAKADAAGTVEVIGLVSTSSISGSGTGVIQTAGVLTNADWTGVLGGAELTAGAPYFLDPSTAGKITASAPATVGQFVVFLGHAISTTKLVIEIKAPILL